MTAKKAVHQSRTNRTVAVLIAAAVGERVARKLGVAPDAVTEVLLSLGEVALGALAIYFRQQANPEPVDKQEVVSPKPRVRVKQ